MTDIAILREERKGYIHFKAFRADSETVVAAASYWPSSRSAYVWHAAGLRDPSLPRDARRDARYNVDESDILSWLQEEAQNA